MSKPLVQSYRDGDLRTVIHYKEAGIYRFGNVGSLKGIEFSHAVNLKVIEKYDAARAQWLEYDYYPNEATIAYSPWESFVNWLKRPFTRSVKLPTMKVVNRGD